jgi:O-antigen/teichoic acid export membrane protein
MTISALKRNAIWNLIEVAASTVVLFILYRLILKHIGIGALGVWSLVLATTSLARVADIGAAGGLGRFIAVSQARGEPGETSLIYVETALIANVVLYVLIGGLLYWPAWFGLSLSMHGSALQEGRSLLPFSIVSLILQNAGNVTTAALIGFHRSYQKSILNLAALAIQVTVAVFTVGRFGLAGLAMAQIFQSAFLVIAGWCLVLRASSRDGLYFPVRIRKAPLRELMGFGLRLQGLNIATFLYDPFTKFAISSVAGIETIGLYELASRSVLQLRQFVVAPAQNLTPIFAASHDTDPFRKVPLYHDALIAIALAAGLGMAALAAGSPVLSLLWMHRIDAKFIAFTLILCAGWFVNVISTPGYFLGIGSGVLRWNIVGSSLTTVLSPLLVFLMGQSFGGAGAAGAAMVSVASGSTLTWALNCRMLRVPLLPSRDSWHRFRRRVGAIR